MSVVATASYRQKCTLILSPEAYKTEDKRKYNSKTNKQPAVANNFRLIDESRRYDIITNVST